MERVAQYDLQTEYGEMIMKHWTLCENFKTTFISFCLGKSLYNFKCKLTQLTHDVHFIIIPPNMTGLLQPLDVGVNRSFLQNFNDCVTEYHSKALADPLLQTKAGNIKVPTPLLTSEFCRDWAKDQPPALWSNAFSMTGLLPIELFDKEKLHPPLRDIYNNMSMIDWMKQHGGSYKREPISDDFDFKEFEPDHAFLKAIYAIIKEAEPFEKWRDEMIKQIITAVKANALYTGLVEKQDLEDFKKGTHLSHSTFEIVQTCLILNRQLKLIEVNVDQVPFHVTEYNSGNKKNDPKIFLYLLDGTFLYDETKQDKDDNGKNSLTNI